MKRISAALMAVALTVSCNIQEALDGDQGGQKSLTSFPDVIVASPKGMPGQAESSDPAVRTITPDGTKVYWEPGDQIALFPGTAIEADRYENVIYNAHIDEPQLSATFVRDDVQWQYEEGDFYLAAYPASAVARWGSTATNACYAEIPAVQTARLGAWDSKAGVLASMSNTTVFEFSHVAAYLKFIVDGGTSPFVSAAVAYPDITQVVTGETSYVKASVTNLTQIKYAEDAITVNEYNAAADVMLNDYRKYNYPSSQAILNSVDGQPFSAGIYYIAILPRTYEKGLSVVFTSSDGKVAVKRISGPVTLNMGEVANVGTIGTLDFNTPLQPYTIWSDAHAANQGVVFWVDEANPLKGLVVSTCTHNEFQWSSENQYYGAVSDSPLENHSIITGRGDYSADKFPAIAYCQQLRDQYGGLWRLPTIEEMRVLYNVYYGRNYISPLRGIYNKKDDQDITIESYPGFDFRYQHSSQSHKQYQDVLTAKKRFDDLLAQIGEPSPASLDGVNVTGQSGNYSIDPTSLEDQYGMNTDGANNGVTYWLSRETRENGNTQGKNAFIVRFGSYSYANAVKNGTRKYVRCVKEVTLEQ